MIAPLAALRAAVAALLEAEARRDLAAIVANAELELVGPGEAWAMGAREVVAQRIAIALDPPAFAEVSGDPDAQAALRGAFARAMRTADTELAEIHVELKLPVLGGSWRSAYRQAPARAPGQDVPDPAAVREGAAALLDALGQRRAAAMVRRAELEGAPVTDAVIPLTRWIVRLAPADRAATWTDLALADRIERAVRDAATRAAEAVSVELGVVAQRGA